MLNTSYAFKATLRSERKSFVKIDNKIVSQVKSSQTFDYGSPSAENTKAVRFEMDEETSSNKRNSNKSVPLTMQNTRR